MLHVGDIVFLPNSYGNFANGKPVYWVLIQHSPDESGLFLCMTVTEPGTVSDGRVFKGLCSGRLSHIHVHTNMAHWLHEMHELADCKSVDHMHKDEVRDIRRALLKSIKGEGEPDGENWIQERGDYYGLYDSVYRHSCVVSGMHGIEDFEDIQ